MARDFEAVLDECLEVIARGAPLDECLARYPKYAARLRPLLETATSVRSVRPPLPDPAGQFAGRQQFMARAAQLKQARHQSRRGLLLKPLAAAASLALLLLVGTGFTSYAATQSQPDSPLYPMKLRLEDARLLLTFGDDDEQLDLMLDQLERRQGEVRWLMAHDKSVEGNVLGELQGRAEDVVGKLDEPDMPANLKERAEDVLSEQSDLLVVAWNRVPAPSQVRYAEALAESYNGLHKLSEKSSTPEVSAPSRISPEEVAGGVVRIEGSVEECCTNDKMRIGGTTVDVPEGTVELGLTSPRLGQKAVVTAARSEDGVLSALKVSVSGVEQQAESLRFSLHGTLENIVDNRLRVGGWQADLEKRTVQIGRLTRGHLVEVLGTVSTNGQFQIDTVRSFPVEEAKRRLIFEGTIDDIETEKGAEYWVVSGQRFLISGAFIDAHPQPYAIGVRVQIEAQRKGQELVALKIVVLRGQGQQGVIKLEGIIEQTRDGWAVGGLPVTLGRNLDQPVAGGHVLLTGRISSEGKLSVSDLVTFPSGLLRLQGPVQQSGASQLIVVGVPFALSDDVEINGTPAVGARAVVWGTARTDGTWEAAYVDVLDVNVSR